MRRLSYSLLAFIPLMGCDTSTEPSADGGSEGADEDVIDERVKMPADQAGRLYFAGAEFTVEPGEDVMMCASMEYNGPDVAFRAAHSLQGKGGHHAILLTDRKPREAGTLVDCTKGEAMRNYSALMIPKEGPPGHATLLRGGTKMVLQSHYINTTDKPMLVRDVVQFDTVDTDDVKTWTSVLATNTLAFEVPAGKTGEMSFDCVIPKDVELLLVGGHMHEWGTKFSLEVGPSADAMKLLHLVDPWQAEYRDQPPIDLYFNKPLKLAAGTVLRTNCWWDNDESHPLAFPSEMCSSFGLVAGTKEPIECRHGE